MDGRRARLIAPVLDNVPRLGSKVPALPLSRTGQRLTTGWAALLALGWPAALWIGAEIEPVPAEPGAAPPLVELAGTALVAALLVTVIGAVRRDPRAAWAAVVTGLITMAFSVTCPLSGHHTLGLWWIGQLGVTAAMLGASFAALGGRSRTTT